MTQARWIVLMTAALVSCGGAKPHASDVAEEPVSHDPEKPPPDTDSDGGSDTPASGTAGGDETPAEAPKTNPCNGFEMDLMAALIQSACEVPNPKPDDKARDLKGKLEVTAMASMNRIPPGGHVDLIVTFTNKTTGLMPLDFLVDPMPRFQVEAYTGKHPHRVDVPPGSPPKVPAGTAPREPGAPSTARITLAANGHASVKLGWDATKMRWAPEKLKGTPPEQGYPRAAAGPLPKGKYVLRVVTPLIGIFEGIDHEMSAPKTVVDVGN
jgi:hypothetical protein